MGQIKFVGSILLVAVFSASLIFFMIAFAAENNAAFNLGSQQGYENSANEIVTNLSTYRTETINATDSFYKSEIQEGETVRTGGQFKLGPGTALSTTDIVLRQGFKSIFGSDSGFGWVLGALLTFLVSILGLLIWKTWKGNPE